MHRQRLKPPRTQISNVRVTAMLLVLMLVSPVIATAGQEQTIDFDFEINGDPILPTYSRTIQLAFDRVGDLDRYTPTELSQTNEWLVITQIPIEKQFFTSAKPTTIESSPLLRGAYKWHLDNPLEQIGKLEESKEMGHIEAFYPLVENQQIPRSTPNDPEFSSQWHLENTL